MGFRFKPALINFAKLLRDPNTSDYDGYAVTPADGTDLPNGPCIGLYVTGAGNVNVNLWGGGTAVLTTVGAGQYVWGAFSRVLSTSTTGTGIFALYA